MKPYHIDEPKDVIELVKNIKTLPTEVMIVLGINEDDCVIYKDNITHKTKKNSATFSLRDIVKRLNLQDITLFDMILQYLIDTTGRELSAENIVKYLENEYRKVSTETIYSYIDALCNL